MLLVFLYEILIWPIYVSYIDQFDPSIWLIIQQQQEFTYGPDILIYEPSYGQPKTLFSHMKLYIYTVYLQVQNLY